MSTSITGPNFRKEGINRRSFSSMRLILGYPVPVGHHFIGIRTTRRDVVMGVEYSRLLVPCAASYRPDSLTVARLLDEMVANGWLPDVMSAARNRVTYRVPAQCFQTVQTSLHRRSQRSFWRRFWSVAAGTPTVTVGDPAVTEAPLRVTPRWLDQHTHSDLQLTYEIARLDLDRLRYPLDRLDYNREEVYYDLKFLFVKKFLYYQSETLEGLFSTRCDCGWDLVCRPDVEIFGHSRLAPVCSQCAAPFDPSSRLFRLYDAFDGTGMEIEGGPVFHFAIEMDCGKCRPRDGKVAFERDLVALCESVLGCRLREFETIH